MVTGRSDITLRIIPSEICGGTGFDGWGVCDNCIGGYAGLRPTTLERLAGWVRRRCR